MTIKRCPVPLVFALAVLSLAASLSAQVIHTFNGKNGSQPYGNLIFDGSGNLYGTTNRGGDYDYGTVFEMSHDTDGKWTEKVIHSFDNNGKSGYYPLAGLIFDTAGNLYGTTTSGGAYGAGTVFELSLQTDGTWVAKVLHSFNNDGTDGDYPFGGLIFDSAGNLYGTTTSGGTSNNGTVFELSPGHASWAEIVLHSFGDVPDGRGPEAALAFDAAGNLYGTTYTGGGGRCISNREDIGCGTVFKLSPQAGGSWTETVLHNFLSDTHDGNFPDCNLIFDAFGNLYGTTSAGGTYNFGTVFELFSDGEDGWIERIVHQFGYYENTGANPQSGLIFGSNGYLYGTTFAGGTFNGGVVFEMIPQADGGWLTYSRELFGGGGSESEPYAGVILDASGNIYGTTTSGSGYGDGAVYELVPPPDGDDSRH